MVSAVYFSASIAPTWGAVINLSPGDLSAPEDSYWALSGAYTTAEYDGVYRNTVRDNSNRIGHREHTLGITRFYKNRLGVPAFLSASVSHHSLHQSKDGLSANGVGDLGLGAGIWTYFNEITKESFGAGLSVTTQTGSYDSSKTLNPGENRIRYNLLARYRSAMFGSYWAELTLQKNWLGDNNNFLGSSISSDPAFSVSTYLAKRNKNFSTYFIGLERNYAGKTYLNNSPINQGQEDLRVHYGLRQPLSRSLEIVLRSSKTLTIKRGYRQSHWFQLGINRRF